MYNQSQSVAVVIFNPDELFFYFLGKLEMFHGHFSFPFAIRN